MKVYEVFGYESNKSKSLFINASSVDDVKKIMQSKYPQIKIKGIYPSFS